MPTTDDRIVQMTFKNEQFERGVKESLHSLEELKKALDLDKSAESLSNLEKIASSFDISGIAKGIDDIANRFTLVGNIGQEAFRRISSFALDEIHKVTNAITSMPQAGLSKYEQKNKSIQMIQSAMPEKSIEEIEAVLEKLNEYTDLTSYDFSTMAQSIGKFVSAGVDLEVAERVMEGIANETASAGGEIQQANIAMYNFSQALAAGSVKMLDWRSIQNQNLDTKEFKEQIIQTAIEMGTLGKISDKVGYIIKGSGKNARKVTVDYQSFANTLSEGWFTSNVMLGVFEKYADRESEVGKKGFEAAKVAITLKQALEAVKDAISTGWMTTFGYLFGNLEEASDLFTRISDSLIDFTSIFSEARNELLKGWHDGGEDGISGYQKLVEGLSNTWSIFMGIVQGAKDAFTAVFGEIDPTGLINASKAFADFTGSIRDFLGIKTFTEKKTRKVLKQFDLIPKWTKDLKKGMKGNEIKDMQNYLLALGDSMIRLDKYGADGIFGPETQAAVKAFQKSVGLEQTGIYDKKTRNALEEKLNPSVKVEEYTETYKTYGEGIQMVQDAFQGLFSIAKAVVGVLKLGLDVAGRVITLAMPIAKGIIIFASGLGTLITNITNVITSLASSEDALKTLDAIFGPLSKAAQIFGGFLGDVGTALWAIGESVKNTGKFDLEDIKKFFEINFDLKHPIFKVFDAVVAIRDAALKAAPAFESLKNIIVDAFNSVKAWVGDKFTSAITAIGDFFTNLWQSASDGDYLAKILNGLATALQVILGIVGGVGYGIYAFVKAMIDGGIALVEFVKNSEFVQNALKAIADFTRPAREFFTSLWQSLTSISSKLSGIKTFDQLINAITDAMSKNPIGKKFLPVLKQVKDIIGSVSKKFMDFKTSIVTAFNALKTFKDPQKALEALMQDPNKNQGAIKLVQFFIKVRDIFQTVIGFAKKVGGTIAGIFNQITPGLKNIGQAIGTAITNFFGGDGTSPGEKISSGFETIKGKLQALFGGLKDWINNFVKNSPFLQSLIGFGEMVRDAVVNFFSMSIDTGKSLPEQLLERLKAFDPVVQWVKDKFGQIKDFLTDPKKLLSHVVGALKGIGEFVINIFKNVNLGTIWDTAKTALGTYIMFSFAKSLQNFSKSFGVLSGAIDKDEKSGIGAKLRSIAITIAIVTAALAGLAFIPADKALAGVGVMTVAIGVVVGALIALNKWAPETKGIGKGILSMALSIGALVAAVAAAALLVNTGGDLRKPLLLVGGMLVALGAVALAMNLLSKNKSSGSKGLAYTILAMCAGLYLVVKAVEKMAKVIKDNPKQVDEALGKVWFMLLTLGTIAVLMSALGKSTGKEGGSTSTGVAPAILAMCTGLSSIVNAVAQMAGIMQRYPDHFGGAFAMIEGLLITIGGIAVLLAAFGKDLDWKVSLASAVPIVAMGFFLDTIIQVMGEAIQKISGVNPAVIEQFLIGVGEALIGMVGVVAIFSKIGVGPLLEAAVGIIAIMTAIGLGVDIVATFAADAVEKLAAAMWLVGSRLGRFSENIANVDEGKIKSAMDLMTNTILPAMVNMVAESSVITEAAGVAGTVWRFGIYLGLFQRSISGITTDTGAAIRQLPEDIKAVVEGINGIQGIKAAKDVLYSLGGALKVYYGDLAGAMDESGNIGSESTGSGNFDITKANAAFQDLANLTLDDETIAKLQGYATGGDQDLNTVAGGITNIGTALKQYGEDISGIDPDKVETANEILDKIKDVDQHINPLADTNFEVLNGKQETITEFGGDVAALGGALAQYSDSIATLNPAKVIMANAVMDAVASLANKLPTTGGLWQMLAGEQNLGDFAVNMGDLGNGLAEYANQVSSANFTNVSESVGPIMALARAQSIIQRNGGLASVLSGSAQLGELGTGLVGLGKALVEFATAEEGIKTLKETDFTQIGLAIEPIKKLAEAQSILQNEGGWTEFLTGSSNLGNLGQGLENFASYLITFKDTVQSFDFDDTKFVSAMDLLEKTVSLQEIVQNGDDEYDFANAGRNVALLFAVIADAITNDTQISDAITTAAAKVKEVITSEAIDQASTWGLDLVTNLANGMKNNAELVRQAAEHIAGVISSYLHFTEPDVGPLSNMHEWMPDFTQNLADGLMNGTPIVEQATSALADKMSQALGTSLQNLFGIGGEAGEPVITPVLDLTNVEDGASLVQGMLNGQSISVGSGMAQSVGSGNGVTIIQGGATEDHSPEIIASIEGLNKDIVTLMNQMSNLRVVMNTNALVGQIAPAMDRALGTSANRG